MPASALLLSCFQPFAVGFTAPTFAHARTLVQGTLLASGRRTVAAALRTMGRGDERHFTTFHRVLNRSRWSPRPLSRILLQLLVTMVLAPDAPLVLLVDGTLERRWGRTIRLNTIRLNTIRLQGRYHDAVRSQTSHVATSEGIQWQGIQWLCLLLLVPSPWSARHWALPVLTVPTRRRTHDPLPARPLQPGHPARHSGGPFPLPTRHAAWYAKAEPTFVDVLVAVRRQLRVEAHAPTLRIAVTMANARSPSSTLLGMLVQSACYAS